MRTRSPRPDRLELRATVEVFDREMSALVELYGERATAPLARREEIDAEIARTEEHVRDAWSRLGAVTREPLATRL